MVSSQGVRIVNDCRAIFEEGAHAHDPHGSDPAAAKAQLRMKSQMDLAEELETGTALSGLDARSVVSLPQSESPTLHLSSSEKKVDVVNVATDDHVEKKTAYAG
ncbi:hypothetical protein M9458_029286 [Cirrhinus mrigala]|uniref:Uncharacterized protein n=1 Tax=Cirrhinus mrigala TaxID=683832 RepID=A0ABD0PWG4_CIRMR